MSNSSSKRPIPAIRHYRFNEVNNRAAPSNQRSNRPDKQPAVRVASISTDTRRVSERRVPISLPPNHFSEPPVASSSTSLLPDPDMQPDFPQNEFGEVSRWASFSTSSFLDENEPDVTEDNQEMEEVEENDAASSRGRYTSSDNPFYQLKEEAPEMLKEIMRMESRGGSHVCAGHCSGKNASKYRCRDCDGHTHSMFCQECMVDRHKDRPYDKIEEWNGSYFQKTSLRDLGMSIQLCHPAGEKCKFPRAAKTGFVVMDIDFVQRVDLYYCGSVEAATDVAGINDTPTGRYDELTRVLRMFRCLRMLKRGGIGNSLDPDLVNIPSGTLVVKCPACPRPEVNLPENWLEVVKEKQFLFYKFISVDACFRLKRQAVSSETKDPGQLTRKAYHVEQADYQKQMALMKDVPEEKVDPHCTGHGLAAIEQAYTKFQKGYSTTGCILCLRARHEIVEPNGIADLDVGEKFWHMDWAISASQMHSDPLLTRILSYDICCQYHVHFFERLTQVPEHIRIEIHIGHWRFVVPKLHIKGHGQDCQEEFAFHILPGAGQTDGEGIERQWASLGPIGTNTKEMGP
ncbi:hypothetical protein V5O48_015298, partial [Marasmius crinis-equi]